MSEFKGDTAESASEKPDRRATTLTLTTARNMLPLVRRIIDDLLQAQRALAQLLPEEDRLQRLRRLLSWPERARRYQLQEELAQMEKNLKDAQAEIDLLGLSLLDPASGRVGFPTIVNGKRAFFSWRPGDETLRHWHYAGESNLRPIPASWEDPVESGSKR